MSTYYAVPICNKAKCFKRSSVTASYSYNVSLIMETFKLAVAVKVTVLTVAIMIAVTLDASAGQPRLKNIHRVILDPGHGGRDFGARSRNLVLEKDVTRRLALTLKETIETNNGKKRVKVFFTHSGAGATDQLKRSFNANSNKGDVYLSFHAASGFDQSPRDLGIYISEKGSRSRVAWEEVNIKHSAASGVLAEKLKKKLGKFYVHKKFQIKSGSFLPLYGVDMPAVMVEVIALNDPRDELLLGEEDFYEKLAEAFYIALLEYDKNL